MFFLPDPDFLVFLPDPFLPFFTFFLPDPDFLLLLPDPFLPFFTFFLPDPDFLLFFPDPLPFFPPDFFALASLACLSSSSVASERERLPSAWKKDLSLKLELFAYFCDNLLVFATFLLYTVVLCTSKLW